MSPLEKHSCRVQDRAMARAQALVAELRREGWDFVAVQLACVVSGETESLVPGAQLFRCSAAIGPALPREADTLRGLADHLDAEFRKLGCQEATEGYVQELPLDCPLDSEAAQ